MKFAFFGPNFVHHLVGLILRTRPTGSTARGGPRRGPAPWMNPCSCLGLCRGHSALHSFQSLLLHLLHLRLRLLAKTMTSCRRCDRRRQGRIPICRRVPKTLPKAASCLVPHMLAVGAEILRLLVGVVQLVPVVRCTETRVLRIVPHL